MDKAREDAGDSTGGELVRGRIANKGTRTTDLEHRRIANLPPRMLCGRGLRQVGTGPEVELMHSVPDRKRPQEMGSCRMDHGDYADPRDQYINDLNLAAQGKNRGVPRVVVNNQQKVALAALSTCWCNPDFESTSAFSLVPELVDLPARNRLDYVASLVTESDSIFPLSVEGEPALSSDVLEDREFELECLAAALPRFASMLLCPEGDPDAPDIPTLRSYAEAIMGPYSSQWQTAMDKEMASWKSTGTYVDIVSPSRANIVD
ncbi:unnamed protein product, partial [Closterium sp. NIES-54]